MTDERNSIDAHEAREALGSVEEMKQAAVRRGLPPRWLGALISALLGALFAGQASDEAQWVGVAVFGVFMLMALVRRRQLLVMIRSIRLKITPTLLAGQLTALTLILGLIVAGRNAEVTYGISWASVVVGPLISTVFYALFEFKRFLIRRQIESEYAA